MYATLINGKPQAAPNPLSIGGTTVFNPTGGQYIQAGYKPVVYTPQPEVSDGNLVYYADTWTETETQLVQSWAEAVPPEAESTVPTLEERVSAVEGAVMELAEVIAGG